MILENQTVSKKTLIFEGLIFVFTGSLEKFSRAEAKEMVEAYGGKATGSVSNRTHYLVAGKGMGSKKNKADAMGVKVITESEFLGLLGQ